MARYPGFDASLNIGMWTQNVSDFDAAQARADGRLEKIIAAAQNLMPLVDGIRDNCPI
jgi:hypothetical protein